MNLIIVSGLSGSGKSIALHALEDLGYFCIDNLPFGMLRQLTGELQQGSSTEIERVAVSIDSRSREFLKTLSFGLEQLRDAGVTARIVFLEADTEKLLQRYSETRRSCLLYTSPSPRD